MALTKYTVMIVEAVVSAVGFIVFIAIHPAGWTYASVAIAFIAADGVKGISAAVAGFQISSQQQQTAGASATNSLKPPG